MSERPLITTGDLMGLVGHGLQRDPLQDVDVWVERNGFDPQALIDAARFMFETWQTSVAGEELAPKHLIALALGSFTFGWDAHRDLRGERDDGA